MRVVIVEDDPDLAYLLRVTLSRADVEVLASYTASASARRGVFWSDADAALVDWHVADGTTAELLAWLAAEWPDVCRVVLTAWPHGSRDGARDLADVLLDKPASSIRIIEALGAHL